MPTDFRDGRTFPRRGREELGGFLWLARVFDKARAKANQTQDGYIYPCPMDRAVLQHWGINPREFTSALADNGTDDRILAWVSQRVPQERMRMANSWVTRQKSSLDRHDAEEGVPGAVSRPSHWQGIIVGLVAALGLVLVSWLAHHRIGH